MFGTFHLVKIVNLVEYIEVMTSGEGLALDEWSPVILYVSENVENFQKPWKTQFSKQDVTNCFGGTFDHFLGKGNVLA